MVLIYVGIDVAKDKHDCCILGDSGTCLRESFSFSNDKEGFSKLIAAISAVSGKSADSSQIRTGLEATGHYSANLVAFLRSSGFQPVVFNPLRVKLYRQAISLRRTKTDKADAKCIAGILMSEVSSPVTVSYQIQELKSLTRHRHRLVAICSRSKVSMSRMVDLLFPELPSLGLRTGQASTLALMAELPGADMIAACRIDRLTNILRYASKGRYGREKAEAIKSMAKNSIARTSKALSLELSQVIEQIRFFKRQIAFLDRQIAAMVAEINTPLLTIPGIGFRTAAVILAEIGDIRRFKKPDQLQAFAGLDPSTYQSGKFNAANTPMVKHGSKYLRWSLMQAARLCSIHCRDFRNYMEHKIAQGKHYFVALGHLSKKLIRVIFHMLYTNEVFVSMAA